MGAGKSGSGLPFGVSSIQRTMSPFEYVCSTLNSIDLPLVGNGPAAMVNNWNSPGSMRPRVQVILVTASLILPSSVLIGIASFALSADHDQPGVGCTATDP